MIDVPFPPGNRHRHGFTLIELMVVIVIIGIIVSFAGLSIRQQGDQRLETEAKRIHHLIKLASDEAIMQAREYAVRFAATDYAFLNLDPKGGEFVPIVSDQMFRRRELDPDLRVKLEVEGEEVELIQSALSSFKKTDAASADPEQAAGSNSESNKGSVESAFDNNSIEAKLEAEDQKPVDIFILSSGEVTPFKLILTDAEGVQGEYVIEGSFGGDIAYKPPNAPEEVDDAWTF